MYSLLHARNNSIRKGSHSLIHIFYGRNSGWIWDTENVGACASSIGQGPGSIPLWVGK